MTKCPKCGHENAETEQLCVHCGEPLIDLMTKSATRALEDTDYEVGAPKWGAARIGDRAILRLDIVDTEKQFQFDVAELGTLGLGRVNPDTGERPAIDLSDYGALDKGVSRLHAHIKLLEGALYVIDNHSANGTYVNGQKLLPEKPRIIRDGDDIRLGHLVLRVSFLRA